MEGRRQQFKHTAPPAVIKDIVVVGSSSAGRESRSLESRARFQMVHHDLWDYDLPSPPALITLERDGEPVPAVVQSTKMGRLFVFHPAHS